MINKLTILITLKSLFLAFLSLFILSVSASESHAQISWPTESQRVTSPMGCREPPGPGASSTHLGVDVGGTTAGVDGDPIYAATTGTVVAANYSESAGNIVQIQTPDGQIQTTYMHLDTMSVSVGDTVSSSTQIGTMGNTGNSFGTHLDFRVEVNGVYVDPVAAAGADLTDPAVVAALIESGEAIAACETMGSSAVNSTSGGGTAESCNSEILSTGEQLQEGRMNAEKQMIDEAISKPQSVMELSCFDQFGEKFNQQIGSIFGNMEGDIISGTGLDVFGFGEIFADVQSQISSSITGAINDGLLGGRGETIGDSVTSAVTDSFSSFMGGGGGGGSFACDAMNIMWEIMQCEGILDFKIPSLNDLIGDIDLGLDDLLSDLRPDSCAGEVLYDAALDAAGRTFSAHGDSLPDALNPSNLGAGISSY